MSQHEYLDSFHKVIAKIEAFGFAESIDIKEDIRAAKQLVIKAKIFLINGSVLQIKEYIDAKYKIEKISYAYQYQDEKGKLIFRYDNARHKPNLGFNDHKHLYNGSIVRSSMPDLSNIVDEVIKYL